MADRRQTIIWIKGGLVYWRIDASLGLNELSCSEETDDSDSHSYTKQPDNSDYKASKMG